MNDEVQQELSCQCGKSAVGRLTMKKSAANESVMVIEMHTPEPTVCPLFRVDAGHWALFMELYFAPPRQELRVTQTFLAALVSSLGGTAVVTELALAKEQAENPGTNISVTKVPTGFELSTSGERSRIVAPNGAPAGARVQLVKPVQ